MSKNNLPRIEDDKRSNRKLENIRPGTEIVLHYTGKTDLSLLHPLLRKHGVRLKIHLLVELNEVTIGRILTIANHCLEATTLDVGGAESVDFTLSGKYAATGDYGKMVSMLGKTIDHFDATLPPAAVYNANLQLTKWREFAMEQKRIHQRAMKIPKPKKESAQQRINRIFR